MNRELLIRYLTDHSFEIIEAKNGREAIKLARQYHPDLVLMDVKMPVMDGKEATKQLKKDPVLKDIPIIIVTASALSNQKEEIRQAGSDGHLNKPVARNELFSELIRFLPYMTIDNSTETTVSATQPVQLNQPTPHPELKAKLPLLLKRLDNVETINRIEMLKEAFIIDEIEEFAKELQKLEKEYQSGLLLPWAETLLNDLETFDIPKVQKSLSDFPQLLEQLKTMT